MPPLTLSVFADEKIEKFNNEFSVVNVSTFVENIGDADAKYASLFLDIPEELELVKVGQGEPTNRVVFGTVQPNEQRNNVFQLRVKDEYYNTRDKDVDLVINLEYKNPPNAFYETKQIVKKIKIVNTPLTIVSSTGLKNIKLAGPLDGPGYYDTDNDGLLDIDEVNIESGLVSFGLDGRIKLPTLSEALSKNNAMYVQRAFTRLSLILNSNNIYILPITSDPTDPDSDKDGILDNNELRFDRLKFNHTKVDVSLIDDSKCFDSGYVAQSKQLNKQDTLDKKLISGSDINKNFLKYSRHLSNGGKSVFEIEIQQSSDYIISVPYGANITIDCEVYYKGIDHPTQPVVINKIVSDYNQKHYNLIIDDSFIVRDINLTNITSILKITINNLGSTGSYTINMEQDNWVYAPYGGYCNEIVIDDPYGLRVTRMVEFQMYFNRDFLTEIERLTLLKDYKIIDWVNATPSIPSPVDTDRAGELASAINETLLNTKENKKQLDKFMDTVGAISTYGGIICLFIPGGREAKLLEVACTVIGIANTGYSLLNPKAYNKEKITKLLVENDCNIVYKKSDALFFKHRWGGWTSPSYINKYSSTSSRWSNIVAFDNINYYNMKEMKFVEALPDFN